MPCYHPNTAFQNIKTKQRLKFTGRKSYSSPIPIPEFKSRYSESEWKKISVPCGQCIGCRLEHSRQWAMRCVHEASLYENNSFITLTYSPLHLPKDGSINKRDPVLFMKKLRKHFAPLTIRSYGCAEYGEKNGRPHYHICLFNVSFSDMEECGSRNGQTYYSSPLLNRVWGKGNVIIGEVNFETAAYVARYITKKIKGNSSVLYYDGKLPEQTICVSRRPGLGKLWFQRFTSDVYPSDFVIIRGKRMRPPKYYDRLYEDSDFASFEAIKLARSLIPVRIKDTTKPRMQAREKCHKARAKQLKRAYENDT